MFTSPGARTSSAWPPLHPQPGCSRSIRPAHPDSPSFCLLPPPLGSAVASWRGLGLQVQECKGVITPVGVYFYQSETEGETSTLTPPRFPLMDHSAHVMPYGLTQPLAGFSHEAEASSLRTTSCLLFLHPY